MGEWGFLSGLFDKLQAHSPMLGRFWLFLMLVFRILILGTVASDLFEDEQEEFACNTLQPGCKQVCYDLAFPISLYRFWVFHIVLISTPALLFLLYAMHRHHKKQGAPACREDRRLRRLYVVNVAFRLAAEVAVLVVQWWLYGFRVEAQFPCSRFPCPYTVDCFTSRPAEKTVFLGFYFIVGVVSALSSFGEICYASVKWFCSSREPPDPPDPPDPPRVCENPPSLKQGDRASDRPRGRAMSESVPSSRLKGGSVRSGPNRKTASVGRRSMRTPTGVHMV